MLKPIRTNIEPAVQWYGHSVYSTDGHVFPTNWQDLPAAGISYVSLRESLDTTSSEDRFEDTYDFSKSQGSWDRFNSCRHYKRAARVNDAPIVTRTWASSPGGPYWTNYGRPAWNFYTLNVLATPVHPLVAYGVVEHPVYGLPQLVGPEFTAEYFGDGLLEDRALQAMLPTMRPSTSILNSIFELKDLHTLPKTLNNVTKGIDSINALIEHLKHLRIPRGRFGRKTLRQLFKAPADYYLQNKFNLLTLLSDIAACNTAVNRVNKRVSDLLARANQPQKRHYSCPISGLRDSRDDYSGIGLPGPVTDGGHYRLTVYSKRLFSATLEYSFSLGNTDVSELRYAGLLDDIGANLSLQTIWNAIPWTFVIDWVAGIGPWLRQFTPQSLPIVTVLGQYCVSSNVERTVKVYLKYDADVMVSDISESAYCRIAKHPPLISSLKLSGLNPSEFSLGTALLITRRT